MKKILSKIFIVVLSLTVLAGILTATSSCFSPKINFTYTKVAGGTAYEISDCNVVWPGKVKDRTMVIPSSYNGLPVIGIGAGCFQNSEMDSMFLIEKLYIPSSIKYIKGDAFLGQQSSKLKVYIEDLTAWCNISFGSSTANPLNGCYVKCFEECGNFDGYNGADLYLNGALVENLVIPNGIVKISDYAFCGGKFKSITFNNNLTEIGVGAFAACRNVETIDIPNSVETIGDMAFASTNALQLFVGENVTHIGDKAFNEANYLVEVINNSKALTFVKGADDNGEVAKYALDVYNREAFSHSKLAKENGDVVYERGEDKYLIKAKIDDNNVIVPDGITAICRHAFGKKQSLSEIQLPKSLNTIYDNAFSSNLDTRVKYYGDLDDWYKIDGIGNLTHFVKEISLEALLNGEVEIPPWMTEITDHLFERCVNVEKAKLHESITKIGGYSFSDCVNLKSINLPSGIEEIGENAFNTCSNLQGELVLPANLKKIGGYSFSRCKSLTGKVTIPSGVTEILHSTFLGCEGLTNIVLHEGITYIGHWSLADCTGIKGEFYLPSSVKEIGYGAFNDSGITSFRYNGTKNQFYGINFLTPWNEQVKLVVCLDGEIHINP